VTARMTGLIGQRATQLLVFFSAAILFGSPALRAAPIATDINYSTTGWVGNPYGPSSTPIGFIGVDRTIPDFHWIDLGKFHVSPLPGIPTIFTDTPFGIEFRAPAFNKTESDPKWGFKVSYGTFTVLGRLNGTLGINGQSDVVATVDKVVAGPGPYQVLPAAGLHVSGLPFAQSDIRVPQVIDLSTGPYLGRFVGVTAQVVPEPSSSLVFLLAGSALGAWRLRGGGRARRGA
jgi:hypothetical protein